MPAFVPIYSGVSAVFNPFVGYQFVIILQFVFGILSVVWVARLAGHLAQNKKAYYVAGSIYAVSLLIAVWDPILLSDSLGNFRFSQLKPGAYTIEVSGVGFKTKQLNNIPVTTGNENNIQILFLL
jgi:hypothetical protein